MSYSGKYMCGLVEVEGEPITMMVCHYKACRSCFARPENESTLLNYFNLKLQKVKNLLIVLFNWRSWSLTV